MSVVNNNLLLTADAGVSQYQVQRSVRFNSADSAYLNRTPSVAGNRKTWTWAGWVKRCVTTNHILFNAGTTSSQFSGFQFTSTSRIEVFDYVSGYTFQVTTTAVYRDLSAWMHVLVAFDASNATTANRVRIYVNGSEVTSFAIASYPANADYSINSTSAHNIGRSAFNGTELANMFLADVHFIDGQALTPSSFTETNATTGQLVPKAYSGTYGTNGFRLNFSDNSAATAATLGADSSGNGNNWTPNNLSVTAGAGNDSLTDTPTSYGTDTGAGGVVRGNYATWNPLAPSGGTFSNGNLDWASPTTDQRIALSTISISTAGKWYCEYTIGSKTGSFWSVGIFGNPTVWSPRRHYRSDGPVFNDSSQIATYASFTQGDIIGLAFDSSTSVISFYKNGILQGSLTTSPSASSTNYYFGCTSDSSGGSMNYSVNFGQRPFAYAAPSGFKALCDTNIPEGTITTSGTFTGNANADGPFVYLNGVPTAMTINSNAVTFATHADKLANGFKVRSSSGSYNAAGSNTYSITTTGAKFKYARAQANP